MLMLVVVAVDAAALEAGVPASNLSTWSKESNAQQIHDEAAKLDLQRLMGKECEV